MGHSEAPKAEVNVGAWTKTARVEHQVRAIVITTGERILHCWESPEGDLTRQCGMCGATGTRWEHMNVDNGRCWHCGGDGHGKTIPGGLEEAIKRERRNWLADQRRERQRLAQVEARKTAARIWRAANPELVAELDALFDETAASITEEDKRSYCNDYPDPEPTIDTLVAYKAESLFGGRFRTLLECAIRVRDEFALEDATTAALPELLSAYQEAVRMRQSARYAPTSKGEKYTITGRVTVTWDIDGMYGWSRMFIIDGEGDHAGITVKCFSTAENMLALQRGDRVSVTGKVKKFQEYKDTPQTELGGRLTLRVHE